MKKVFVLLTALVIGAGTAAAQDAGQWSHGGGFEGSATASFPKGSPEESWENSTISSVAGLAYFSLTYQKRAWNVTTKLQIKENAFIDAPLTINWEADMAGFLAEASLGTSLLNSSLGALSAAKLKAWMYLLDRQLEVRFAYNQTEDAVFSTPGASAEWGEVSLGSMNSSNGKFRLLAAPIALSGLKFGAVMPIPLASGVQPISFVDDFLLRSHLFAGYALGNLTIRGGYWMAPEESSASSYTVAGLQYKNLFMPGITLYEVARADSLNKWEKSGSFSNHFGVTGIPVPVTKGLALTYNMKYSALTTGMWNQVKAVPSFKFGPVGVAPLVSYEFERYVNEFKSGVTVSYASADIPFPSSFLNAQVQVLEEGVQTQARASKDLTVSITPKVDIFTPIVPLWVGFQFQASAPILIDLTDDSKSKTELNLKPYINFNLKRQSMGYREKYDGGDNQIYAVYNLTYDITNNLSNGSFSLFFKMVW